MPHTPNIHMHAPPAAALIVVLACLLGLSACGGSSSTGTAAGRTATTTVAAATSTTAGTATATTEAAKTSHTSTASAQAGSSSAPPKQSRAPHFRAAFRRALAAFAACMRHNGVPLPAPDTSGAGPVFSTKGVNTASAAFKAASAKCQSVLRSAFTTKT